MILWELFITFFKIGLFTFGGGYAMIPLIQTEVISRGWMDVDTFYNFIAIAESSPGPFAINRATFVGAERGGVFGAIITTFGLVLPSFIVILIVAKIFLSSFKDNRYVRRFMESVKPVIIGLLFAVSFSLIKKSFLISDTISFKAIDLRNIAIFLSLIILKLKFKKLSPIALIAIAAAFGMILFSF